MIICQQLILQKKYIFNLSLIHARKVAYMMTQKKVGINEGVFTDFLFDISKQVKHFYETPVIFLTQKDYSADIFNTLCALQSTLQSECKTDIIDTIVDFHLKWLYAIQEVEQFSKRSNDLTRDEIYEAISYTIDAIASRLKNYQRYIVNNCYLLSSEKQFNINADCEIVEEMHKDVIQHLLHNLKCIRSFDSNDEFKIKLRSMLDDLLNWIDNINDSLSILLCRYINVNVPHINGDLTKTLQQIVDDFKHSKSPASEKLFNELETKGKQLETMIRCTAEHSLEMSKVVEKINTLDNRISRLENEPNSAALMALKHKRDYLESVLHSFENLKITLKDLLKNTKIKLDEVNEEELCFCDDFFQLRIFNHDLPPKERERLVSELCRIWNKAVFGERGNKSIISILSAAEFKEEYTDDFGKFFIDEYSRKIYKTADDENFYQVDEQGKLVPLADDSEHVYFYDECGRYYIDHKTRLRIYKAHVSASEYMMDNTGLLLKLREERDGIVYYYDNYGRYYVNEEGKHIYHEANSTSEYENDGLGNLVRIRSHSDIFEPCPDDVNVTEDSKYLQISVGKALRECIADVILHQPVDPIKHLSDCLLKYKQNMDRKEQESKEKEEFELEREVKIAEERAADKLYDMRGPFLTEDGSENSYDSNLINYTTMQPGEDTSYKTK